MSTADYDEVEKIFNGTWKYDRDENLKAFMDACESPDELKKMADLKPVLTFTRDGNTIKEKTVMAPGLEFSAVLRLNEVFEWKDNEENPKLHVKSLPTFKDGVLTQDITPQMAGGGKRHLSKMSVKGDELIVDMSLPEGSTVTAKRIYKKC